MELVYLWVEKYKNIEKQGFNFSPRFRCEYNEDTDELTIDENKNYVSIFPKNINVTAIVGENGSGKSRILECIEKIILANNANEIDDFKYILVYYNEVSLYISNMEINSLIEKATVFDDCCSLVYKYYVSKEKVHQAHYYSSANLHYSTLEKQGIVNILSAKQDNMSSFHISSFMYEPIKVEITLKSYGTLIQEHLSFLDFHKRDEIDKLSKNITDPYHQYLSILYIRQKGLDVDFEILKNKEPLMQNTKLPLSEEKFSTFFMDVITMKEYEISKMSQDKKDIYFHEDYWHYFEFDFIDEKERKYNHLSHGEKAIFSQLLSMFFYINANEKLLFLFDEPEIALHPNWQKKYLNEVINLLQKISKKYHFVFATHSPFLISDIPKQNLIFLEKDEETGLCVDSTNSVNLNPFGANIHTLLSHGFFMENGLMGEFAKEKINDVYSFIAEKNTDKIKNKEEAQNIINIIGEPLIKKQLQKLYDETFGKSILDIDDEINILEKKLTALKALKNDKN